MQRDPLSAPAGLHLRPSQREQMLSAAQQAAPEEACGLILGVAGEAREVYVLENELHSPVRFRMRAEEQLRVLLEADRRGWALLAIFHSHPQGPPFPSPADLLQAAYPEAVYLILSGGDGERWGLRGFTLQGWDGPIGAGEFREVGLDLSGEGT